METESTARQDTAAEYLELQRRLANAEISERQYLVLLGRARDEDDILKIYQILSRVRCEVELITERMQRLEQTSPLMLPAVYARPIIRAKPPARTDRTPGVLKSAARGLVTAGLVLGSLLVWLLMLPLWAVILGIMYWRRLGKRAAGQPDMAMGEAPADS